MSVRSKKTLIFADTDNGGIVHVANIKGGVGKSTVATNLAAALARRGPTLLVDLDVQGSATHALGKNPTEFALSSWQLLAKRFSAHELQADRDNDGLIDRFRKYLGNAESTIFPQVVGKGALSALAVHVQPCLDLVPANADLFRYITRFHIQNLIYNLRLCRQYYKYIVLDTPSIWNELASQLFQTSDLNLIPVTLNALSTRSLRDYLLNVKDLARKNPRVRIRIVKNEVFGKQGSKIKGKTRTMSENRKFLESLCEQSVIQNASGVSLLPQSILFDLEIPESATVRDAQDEGKPVNEFQQYSAVTKAFDALAKNVQFVLNRPVVGGRKPFWEKHNDHVTYGFRAAAAVILIALFGMNSAVSHQLAPRPLAPQQLVESQDNVVEHTFASGESMYRVAKYAICYFRARVPSMRELNTYVSEVMDIHNWTRQADEPRIESPDRIPKGTIVKFYPPSTISNPNERELLPVYRFFVGMVSDKLAYVTGDWCERGTGGGTPHYGMDVAAGLGSEILSPIDGIVVCRNSKTAGRMMGVVKSGTVLFFAHMDKRYLKTGDVIKKGDSLGTVGMTGKTSGPHVHIGYGIQAPTGVAFGRHTYKITDPKLFFYRERYISDMK